MLASGGGGGALDLDAAADGLGSGKGSRSGGGLNGDPGSSGLGGSINQSLDLLPSYELQEKFTVN